MRRNVVVVLKILFLLSCRLLYAQDIQYSQFYANVLYLNPAFAGNAHAIRGIFHHRTQWPSLDARYITTHFSVDCYAPRANSGFGLIAYKDVQGASTIATTETALQYAYELHLSSRYSFRAGIQAGYVSRFINYSVLRFPDQYDANGYLGNATNQHHANDKISYLDFTSGGIFYSDKYWAGITYAHMNRPDQSFYGGESRLPVKLEYTGGYRFDFESKRDDKISTGRDIYLTPTFHYKLQGKSDQLDLGVYFLYDRMITGLWYRGMPLIKQYNQRLHNNESFVVLIGFRINTLSISYSFDNTVSKLAPANTAGCHELNITYLVDFKNRKKKVMKKIPCPHFYKT
jgi:type IX secretion system PorP/SprF family membrane protein